MLGRAGLGSIICRMLISRHLLDWLLSTSGQPEGREEKMLKLLEAGGDCGGSRASETLKVGLYMVQPLTLVF